MKLCSASLAVALITSSYCSALPPNKDHKDRVHDAKLSEKEHTVNGEHNQDYDHDAFLGEKDAKDFDELTPEESKTRLGYIVDKIDKDHDGFVTEDELRTWIQYVQKKYVLEDTERMWKDHELEDGKLTWDSYRKRTYGYEYDPEEEEDFVEMVKRDERKFKQADQDKDGKLSKEEFAAFLHPEEHEHMKDIVVLETMEDIDKNKDGKISLDEYIADIYDGDDDNDDDEDDDKDGLPDWVNSESDQFTHFRDKDQDGFLSLEEVRHWIIPDDFDNSGSEAKHLITVADDDRVGDMWPNKEEEEPEWVKGERTQFSQYRDKNGDGFMDQAEVRNWIIPPNYDHSEAEAKHLIYESDGNQDGKLTKEEILDKSDVFVGSQATDFGDALTRHDEF